VTNQTSDNNWAISYRLICHRGKYMIQSQHRLILKQWPLQWPRCVGYEATGLMLPSILQHIVYSTYYHYDLGRLTRDLPKIKFTNFLPTFPIKDAKFPGFIATKLTIIWTKELAQNYASLGLAVLKSKEDWWNSTRLHDIAVSKWQPLYYKKQCVEKCCWFTNGYYIFHIVLSGS